MHEISIYVSIYENLNTVLLSIDDKVVLLW